MISYIIFILKLLIICQSIRTSPNKKLPLINLKVISYFISKSSSINQSGAIVKIVRNQHDK